MIKVLFFAQLKELLGSAGIELDMSTPCDVAQVKHALIAHNPNWQSHLDNSAIMCAVNQTMVEDNHTVKNGDEVAFFPPVTGG